MTPDQLRDVAAGIRTDAASSHLGDPRYSCVISSDKVDAITAAIPELLAQVADLELRVSIAADLTINDRGQIRDLETRIAAIAVTLGADPVQDTEADLATIEAGLAANGEIVDSLTKELAAYQKANHDLEAEVVRLQTRQQELLALTVRLTNEVSFADEVKGWTAQRGAMLAELGTARSRIADLEQAAADMEAMLDAARTSARDVTTQNGELMQLVSQLEVENARLRSDATDWPAMVRAFHVAFDQRDSPSPYLTDYRINNLRMRLIDEERNELIQALAANDIVEVADALADLLYVVIGSALQWGIPIARVFAEVHRSNMSKAGGAKRPDGKILKGPNYSPPDLRFVLALTSDGHGQHVKEGE